MSLTTNFNVSPYFDDYDPTKQYYRILFKGATAVQARELTQLQTIINNQIESFADNIFDDGSIIKGCATSTYSPLYFVRLQDTIANGSLLNVANLTSAIAISNTTGLQAQILSVNTGTIAAYPNTNRIYVRYMNSGNNANGDVKTFQPNELLNIFSTPLSANVLLVTVNTYANSIGQNTSDMATGLGVDTGIIYQKGMFVLVNPQTIVVSDNTNVGNCSVGFITNEIIVNSDNDPSLLDNALGYTNQNAPGADRLQLVANLTVIAANVVVNTSNFAVLAQYVSGVLVINNTDTQYSALGQNMATREDETEGSFVVSPFTVDTVPNINANNLLFTARMSPGLAYVHGYRIQTLRTALIDVRRGTDVGNSLSQLVTTNYGNYITLQEYAGFFDFTVCSNVALYDTAQQALTNHNFSTISSPSGNVIGQAYIHSMEYIVGSGTQGIPSAQFAMYIFHPVMNSGKNFANTRSIYFNNGSQTGVADVVLTNNVAVITTPTAKSLVFGFAQHAVKALKDNSNNINTQYTFRTKTTAATLAVNGLISYTLTSAHAGGTNQFPYGLGNIGDSLAENFIITALANTQSANLTGTVSVNTTSNLVTGSGTTITSLFSVGEYLKIGTDIRRITSIANNISFNVDAVWSVTNASANFVKYIPTGYIFPILSTMVGTRNITINSSTSLTVNTGLGIVGNVTAVGVAITHDVLRTQTVPAKKTINKNQIVYIDTSSHANTNVGPWSLGIPDVHKVSHIYVGATFANTNTDSVNNFNFNTGMQDSHYDLGSISLSGGQSITANSKLMVVFDAFTPNTAPGVGFFTVESYPIDDANTANATAIQTQNIPVFISPSSGNPFPLRDSVDFRPYVANTANLTSNTSLVTTNPSGAYTAFNLDAVGTYVPTPNFNFEGDLQYYIGRTDMLYITTQGYIRVKEGVPAPINPAPPAEPFDGMAVSYLSVPPYPSLSSVEQQAVVTQNKTSISQIRDTNYQINVNIVTNRRYTMRDIGVLDHRISNLEYYVSLNLLEQAATDLQVPDNNGLNRFKNGIFVDPFTSHAFGQVANPEYKIAIDTSIGVARPYFTQDKTDFTLNANNSANVVQTGRLITLPYTTIVYANQPYATQFRSCSPAQFFWTGQMDLYPNYDAYVDTTQAANINVVDDQSQAWEQFANSPWGTEWGDWQTSSTSQVIAQTTSDQASSIIGDYNYQSYNLNTTTQTNTTTSRSGQKIGINTTSTTYNLGNFITDVSIQPYLRSRQIGFKAWSLRPTTTMHAFFDSTNVDASVTTGVLSGGTDTTLDSYVTANSPFATTLKTDANGMCIGKFLIPAGQFRTGQRTFELADVSNIFLGNNAITTIASATYVGNSLSATQQNVSLTTITPSIYTTALNQSYSSVSTSTNTQTITSQTYIPPAVVNTTAFAVPYVDYSTDHFEAGDAGGGGAGGGGGSSNAPDNGSSGDGSGDPLAQGFTVNVQAGFNIAGVYATSIQLFFNQISTNITHGITVYICGMTGGYPDKQKVVPYSKVHLLNNQINVSNTSSVSTTFTFECPVFLNNNTTYAFVIAPDGGDPDFQIWTAVLGENDVLSGTQVFTQPYFNTAFFGANQTTWSALQTEYVKFNLNIAQFSSAAGLAAFDNKPYDFLIVNNMTLANSTFAVNHGYTVYAATNTTPNTCNVSVTGNVLFYDNIRNRLDVYNSNGLFSATSSANTIQIHNFVGLSNTTPTANTLVATANLTSVSNLLTNAVSPGFATIEPTGTSLQWNYLSTSNTYVKDTNYIPAVNGTETDMFDYERRLISRSNEVTNMSGTKSLNIYTAFTTDNSYVSPAIDAVRMNATVIGNLIDPLSTNTYNESYSNGAIQSKYVSIPVVLASGQASQDLQVYLTAYLPLSAQVNIYARFLSPTDPGNLGDKLWTPLVNNGNTAYSTYNDTTDYIEYLYTVPTALQNNVPNTMAYSSVSSNTVLTYSDNSGATYVQFQSFQIKIDLLSNSSARVPILNDVRAICLQL